MTMNPTTRRTYADKPARLLKRTGKHVRIDLGDEEELRRLGRSFLARPINPIIVTQDLEICDGNRRYEGVMLENPDAEVPVCITDEAITSASLLEIQVESAAHTRGLSDGEYYIACTEWLSLNPSATAKDLAARIHRDESTLCKILSLSRGIQAVKDAAMAGLIGYAKWWPICKLPPEEQAAALAACLGGATRDELQRRGRKNGNGRAATVKASSIPVILGSGITVLFKAEGLTLAMALEAVADIKQELKQGIDFNHDARTFAVLMKKRARELAKQR
jgi:hypothetical protein